MPRLKVGGPSADETSTMDRRLPPTAVPADLLASLTAAGDRAGGPRREEVARGRRAAARRDYEDGEVVQAIVDQLLALSASV